MDFGVIHGRLAIGTFVVTIASIFAGAGCGPDDEQSLSLESDGGTATTTVSQAVTLPPLLAVADASIRQAAQFNNDGIGVNLSVSSVSGSQQRSLIRFDQAAIAAAVGSESVYKAQVELTITGMSAGWGGGALELHAMNRNWPEGNGTFGGAGTHGPSWVCANDTDIYTPAAELLAARQLRIFVQLASM